MKTYLCKLIHGATQIKTFYREGHSADDVKEGLELFQWPKGTWRITLANI